MIKAFRQMKINDNIIKVFLLGALTMSILSFLAISVFVVNNQKQISDIKNSNYITFVNQDGYIYKMPVYAAQQDISLDLVLNFEKTVLTMNKYDLTKNLDYVNALSTDKVYSYYSKLLNDQNLLGLSESINSILKQANATLVVSIIDYKFDKKHSTKNTKKYYFKLELSVKSITTNSTYTIFSTIDVSRVQPDELNQLGYAITDLTFEKFNQDDHGELFKKEDD